MSTRAVRGREVRDPGASILHARLKAAVALAEVAGDRLPTTMQGRLEEVVGRSSGRLAVTGDHTVAVLAGPTGVGKSSLFNAILGTNLADVGVTRPTTDKALAAVISGEPVAELMAHLGLGSWQNVAVSRHPTLESLVLVDLPDHDSVVSAHRERAAELVAVADRLLWVVDHEKYADASVHQDLFGPLHEHAGVLTVVLNRVDRLSERDRHEVVADLRRLLTSEGFGAADLVATSTVTGAGIDDVRELLSRSITEHRAANERIASDLRALAIDLEPTIPRNLDAAVLDANDHVVTAAMQAAGIPAVVDAVGATHLHRARRATGWPVLRRIQARGRDPLARLGLRRDRGQEVGTRSSRPVPHGVATATLATAVRERVEAVTSDWPPLWADPVTLRLDDVVSKMPVALDRATAGADLDDDHVPGWWVAVGSLQWVLAAVMAVGALWLVAIFVVAWLQLPDLPMPRVGRLPWPTVMLVGGALAGLLLGALATQVAKVGAARARRRVGLRLRDRVADVVTDTVSQSLAAEASRAAAARAHLDLLAG